MKYASAAAFRMALEQRLLNLARATEVSLARLRKTLSSIGYSLVSPRRPPTVGC